MPPPQGVPRHPPPPPLNPRLMSVLRRTLGCTKSDACNKIIFIGVIKNSYLHKYMNMVELVFIIR